MGSPRVDGTSSTTTVSTREEYDKKQSQNIAEQQKKQDAEKLQKELSGADANVIDDTNLEISSRQQNEITWGEIGMHAGTWGAISVAPEVYRNARAGEDVANLFKGQDAFVAKYPDLSTQTKKLMRDYEKLYKADMNSTNKKIQKAAQQQYSARMTALRDAIKSNDAQAIANLNQQVEEELKVKNKNWVKRTFGNKEKLEKFNKEKLAERKTAGNNVKKAQKTNPAKVTKGTTFKKPSLKGSGLMAGLMVAGEAGNVIAAYKEGSEYGNKQLIQSGTKVCTTLGAYTLGDWIGQNVGQRLNKAAANGHRIKAITNAGKKGALKVVSKTATKTAAKAGTKAAAKVATKVAIKAGTKLAVKGGCKLLGAAIGSVVPGIGNVVGFLIGCVADVVISKCVLPKIKYFQNDAVEEAAQKQLSKDEKLAMLEQNYMNDDNIKGEQLGQTRYQLSKYCTREQFDEMTRIRNIKDDKKREEAINQYFATYYPQPQNGQQQLDMAA